VQSYSRHPHGLYIINGWLRVLTEDADTTGLGQTLLEALHHTEDGVKRLHESRERNLAAFLATVGVRTHGQFAKGTRSIGVAIRPPSESITFIPTEMAEPPARQRLSPDRRTGNRASNRLDRRCGRSSH
jgi:hypothetical protein